MTFFKNQVCDSLILIYIDTHFAYQRVRTLKRPFKVTNGCNYLIIK